MIGLPEEKGLGRKLSNASRRDWQPAIDVRIVRVRGICKI